ncbi:hypothetical protein [Facklamia sp. 7083-14-GEN3]|uniref:hypothetical protein n=1 Tax=Facklamia sp. 7083-14-GEN3 TaxID=2973478 RepID=UPI00215C0DA6|nr:hypothetical protein [Facklamia sp. 7083-14-GEN3]MCR8969461.1 hypothetical protein [Facklamia sp. 7083-14-GEN3]
MTSKYEGPAFKNVDQLAGNKKRKFHLGMWSHRSSEHALEEPAFKKVQKKLGSAKKSDNLLERRFEPDSRTPESFSEKLLSSSYQTVYRQEENYRLEKASQAMRSEKTLDEQFKNEANEMKLPFAYDIPFLQSKDYRGNNMENKLQKDYNNSLPTRESRIMKNENRPIEERLDNIDHSLRAVQRMQEGHQERLSMKKVDRQILKRLVKDKQSFLLFTKEDNE